MRNPPLHRYATRPGLYFTDDGGADAVVRSETADQVWFCVLEPLDQPSAFYAEAVRLFNEPDISFIEQAQSQKICTRRIPSLNLRETLFMMDGPNYGLWYVHIPKAWDGMHYGYRVNGPWDPNHGVSFNPYKLLLDPYAKGIDGSMKLNPGAFAYACEIMNGKVKGSPFGPMSTSHPHVAWSKTVIYELHVKGFTANAPWLPKELRGTYAGLAHPSTLSYLQDLGVTSIELMPIQAKQPELFLQERGRTNYWGYSTLGYFAPEPSYATRAAQEAGAAAVRKEVIDMVRALHEAGFEVIMDVVYNHTCESGPEGPTICWHGLDNLSYYRRNKEKISRLYDTTGCGNTLDFTNTHVVTFAVDSLRYWAKRIGIDGFRFDLAATLARLDGDFTSYHPFLYALRSDMLLGNLKMIMEPWDVGPGGWRTGQFGIPFAEWNDRFRDTTRKFWLTDVERNRGGESGVVTMQEMATRLCGSADLFATDPGRGSTASVNYVACHDGFTMADLTRYRHKHNERNGEDNRDGTNDNHSVNFGYEGPSDDPIIIQQRERAMANMLGMLLLSLGTPMLLSGDEFGNSQNGNNNAYMQDNPTTWLDWDWLYSTEQTPELKQFDLVSRLIALRKSRDLYDHEDFFTRLSKIGLLKRSDRVHWFLPSGHAPHDADWTNPAVRTFAMQLLSPDGSGLMILINGSDEISRFHLPADKEWEMVWSSAEVSGEYPGQGTSVDRVAELNEESENKPAGRFSDHLHRLNMMYWHADVNDGTVPEDIYDAEGADDPTLWTIPALSISVMRQISAD